MNLTSTPKPHRQHRPSRPILAAAVAFSHSRRDIRSLHRHILGGDHNNQGHACCAPDDHWPLVLGPWMGGVCPGTMEAPARCARTEYFHVASTAPSGPGTIIITGVVDAGGTERPGRAIDDATFAGGGFRIDHSAGHPSARFNAETCVGTINQTGPFSVIDGTGRFSGLAGSGHICVPALCCRTARDVRGCTRVLTGYIESIDGTVTLSPSAARAVIAAAG